MSPSDNYAIPFMEFYHFLTPPERIWSRASRILTLKRANLKAKVAQRMMFITENLSALHKYYGSLAKHDTTEDKYFLIELEKTYLPPLGEGDGDDHIM